MTTDHHFLLFRPTLKPGVAVPVGARSVGHYIKLDGWREARLRKHFVQVFWGIAGAGAMVVDQTPQRLGAGQVGVYLPGMEHEVRTLDAPWEYRWWTMDGPLAEAVTLAFGLGSGVCDVAGDPPVALFDALGEAIRDVSPAGERHAGALAYQLLTAAAVGAAAAAAAVGRTAAATTGDPQVRAAIDLLHRHYATPGFGVDQAARLCGLHRSSLSRRFQAAVGVAPIAYLTNLRIQHALSLLQATTLPVADVALRCGFHDPAYFARAIRKATGLSPSAFRRH